MPRRIVLSLSAVLALVLGAATIAFAAGGSSTTPTTSTSTSGTSPTAPVKQGFGKHGLGGPGGGMFGMLRGMVLSSFADRLGVKKDDLKTAIEAVAKDQFAKQATAAGLTDAEKTALEACHHGFGGFGKGGGGAGTYPGGSTTAPKCDRTAARSAFDRLKALPKPDLGALKTELSDALGAKLGITGAKVLEAARAELSARLDQAVKISFLTADGKTKALACFDTPGSCDLKALRGTFRFGGHGGGPGAFGHGFRGRGHRGGKTRGAVTGQHA